MTVDRNRALWGIVGLCLIYQLVILFRWIDSPILDQHGFRQTQTALSTYWIMQGGPFFAYQTPVLGSPWSIPFEFPVYEGVVALVAKVGIPLDPAGRLVSEAFFLAGLWPLRMLWRDLGLARAGLPIACALLIASPLYSFWSRAFMIESCALFLALLWIAFLVRFLLTGRAWIAAAAVLTGLLAAGAKATTLPPFALLGGFYVLPRAWRWVRDGLPAREWPPMLWATAVLIVPFVGGFAWVAYSDALKAANPIGVGLTSQGLIGWNWGFPGQRFGRTLWQTVVRYRVMHDLFGPAWPIAMLVLAGAAALRWRMLVSTIALIVAFLIPFVLFPNLHILHNYYQYANAIFLVVAIAALLGELAARWPIPAAAVLLMLLAGQCKEFHDSYLKTINIDFRTQKTYRIGMLYRIALQARDLLPADGSLLVFGDDWGSTVPYYSRRKTLDVVKWTDLGVLKDILRDPQTHLAGTKFAGVVSCYGPGASPEFEDEARKLVDTFLAGRTVLVEDGICRLLSAETATPAR